MSMEQDKAPASESKIEFAPREDMQVAPGQAGWTKAQPIRSFELRGKTRYVRVVNVAFGPGDIEPREIPGTLDQWAIASEDTVRRYRTDAGRWLYEPAFAPAGYDR